MKRSFASRGFSLIELLTVIAIIAKLAAVIFPVMTSVKERARQQQCMTNLHGIAMGVQMFKVDNRRYPTIVGSEVRGPASGSTPGERYTVSPGTPEMFENVKDAYLFAEYVKTIQAFHCPSASTANSRDVAVYDGTDPGSGTSPGLAVYAYDSYDCAVSGPGQDQGGVYKVYSEGAGNVERHYWIKWAADIAAVGSSGLAPYPPATVTDTLEIQTQDYARQLRFRNPPGETLVTWCSYHEQLDKSGRSLVVFLDGSAASIPAREMNQCKWRIRPKKS